MHLFRRTGLKDKAHRLGHRGERFAAKWLRKQGYRILHRNHRVGDDEADLIALDPDGVTIVIVEVKTRSDEKIPIESSIGAKKRFRMARLAVRLQKSGLYEGKAMRLDAIAILWPDGDKPQLKHYSNAFESPI
ncbi:MAG: YraN family protein [Planctomycetota bacterium]|nr:YraN family protein [Planctomycetota bacterium]